MLVEDNRRRSRKPTLAADEKFSNQLVMLAEELRLLSDWPAR